MPISLACLPEKAGVPAVSINGSGRFSMSSKGRQRRFHPVLHFGSEMSRCYLLQGNASAIASATKPTAA